MILNKIVCSIDLAKKLLTLGVKQNSLFYWFDMGDHHYLFSKDYEQYSKHVNLNIKDGYSAFIAEELAAMLPGRIIKDEHIEIAGEKHLIKYDYHFKITTHGTDHWHCAYIGYPILEGFTLPNLGSSSFSENDENLANAIARMVIYLLENGLMKNEG